MSLVNDAGSNTPSDSIPSLGGTSHTAARSWQGSIPSLNTCCHGRLTPLVACALCAVQAVFRMKLLAVWEKEEVEELAEDDGSDEEGESGARVGREEGWMGEGGRVRRAGWGGRGQEERRWKGMRERVDGQRKKAQGGEA